MREGTYCLKAAFLIEIWPVSAFIFQDSILKASLFSTPHSKIACQESLKPLTKYIEFGPGFSLPSADRFNLEYSLGLADRSYSCILVAVFHFSKFKSVGVWE
jgi:hypothetical protein